MKTMKHALDQTVEYALTFGHHFFYLLLENNSPQTTELWQLCQGVFNSGSTLPSSALFKSKVSQVAMKRLIVCYELKHTET